MPTADKMNSHEMKRYAEVIIKELWDTSKSDALLTRAVEVVDGVANTNYENDNIRTELFTQKVIEGAEKAADEAKTA